MASYEEASTDVIELCAILQCMGFAVKSMDSTDINLSQDAGVRTVVINCQSSGLHVVLEGGSTICSCPAKNADDSSFWQVSGVVAGKQGHKESGSSILSALPQRFRERVTKDLREMVRCIREYSETHDKSASQVEVHKPEVHKEDEGHIGDTSHKSVSVGEVNASPERRHLQLKADTPTRYRSLDTLTNTKNAGEPSLPNPGALVKHRVEECEEPDRNDPLKMRMFRRQSTYSVPSTPNSGGSGRQRNRTSSPIHETPGNLIDSLRTAEQTAAELQNHLSLIIKELAEDRMDSSMSSLALDVSKISLLKGADTKTPYASSPNLSGLGTVREGVKKTFLYASTSNLSPGGMKATPGKENIKTRLKRLSPSFFKKKDPVNMSKDISKLLEGKTGITRPKIVTPVRVPRPPPSPNVSASAKKRFSHIKSTIPRFTPVKKEASNSSKKD